MIRIYNPSHDMVLAEPHRASFTPHKLIQQFEKDLSLLPLWYGKEGDKVVSDYEKDVDYERNVEQLLNVSLSECVVPGSKKIPFIDFEPWGINEAICRQFTRFSDNDLLNIEKIRDLSHRRISIDFLRSMKDSGLFMYGKLPMEVSFVSQIFDGTTEEVVIKLPWSSSGRGVIFANRNLPDNHPFIKRINSSLSQLGSVLLEQKYEKVLDFAVEFERKNDEFVFAGFSLFNTENGAYTGNILDSNENLRNILLQYVSAEDLDKSISVCENRLTAIITPDLRVNNVGVDMMVVDFGGEKVLHPCIEVNLRMTMGFVARIFFDRYVQAGHTGKMEVTRHKSYEETTKWDIEMRNKYPLVVSCGRIESGYLRLTRGKEFNVYALIN